MVMRTTAGAMMVGGSDCPFWAKNAHYGQSVGIDTKEKREMIRN